RGEGLEGHQANPEPAGGIRLLCLACQPGHRQGQNVRQPYGAAVVGDEEFPSPRQNAYVRGAEVLGVLHDLRESLETVARQIACVISGTSQRVPHLTVQSGEPATESLDRRLSRRLTLRLRYDGSFWDALHGEERIGGRNSPLLQGRSTHRFPRAHPCPRLPRRSPTTQGNEPSAISACQRKDLPPYDPSPKNRPGTLFDGLSPASHLHHWLTSTRPGLGSGRSEERR